MAGKSIQFFPAIVVLKKFSASKLKRKRNQDAGNII
jgi:hypothetical protein